MSSGLKPGPESDTDSMAEYGEGETGKFNLQILIIKFVIFFIYS